MSRLPILRAMVLAAPLLLASGCASLGGNVKGSFACRAPEGTCAPTSAIDAGATGIGGARDIVELTANVSYEALFPFYRFIGGSSIVNLSSKTYLKTQPYKQQQARQPVTGVCP